MLTVMLCGAADTESVLADFRELSERMGFEAWSFLDGTIRYRNSATSDWRDNSRASILEADIAVFVVVEQYGEIAWTEELSEALRSGLPFLVLCKDSTFVAFREHQRMSRGPAPAPLFSGLDLIEREHQVTIVPFGEGFFAITLQQHLTGLLQQAAAALRERNARATQRLLLTVDRSLRGSEAEDVRRIALDETEDKYLRKRAMDVLDRDQRLDLPTLVELARSLEQGIARKALAFLPGRAGDVTPEHLDALLEIVHETDDVGMDRRLINATAELAPALTLHCFERLRIDEVGSARRILGALLARRDITGQPLDPETADRIDAIITRCLGYRTAGGGVSHMANELRHRLGRDIPGASS